MRRLTLLLVLATTLAGCRSAGHYYRRGLHSDNARLKVEYFSRALEREPDHLGALRQRGAALLLDGKPRDALRDFDRAVAVDPAHAPTLSNRAVARMRVEDRAGARADLEAAVAADPSLAEAHDNLGRLCELDGDDAAALAAYGKAIEADPEHVLAYLNRARLRFRTGQLPDARADYLEAIDRGDAGHRALAYQDLVLTWIAARKVDRATRTLEEAQRRVPASPAWVYLFGALLYVDGRYEQAGQMHAEAHVRRYQRQYCYLFMALATERVYDKPCAEVASEILARERLEGWPLPILEAYAGRIDAEAALARASDPGERAVAGYFLGERALLAGDEEAARKYFALAAAERAPTTPEKHLAALRLAIR